MFGVDSPVMDIAGTWRVGLFTQYERDPLLLYEFGQEAGTIVTNRQALNLGFSYDVNERVGLMLTLPGGYQWDSEVPELSGDGVLVGDVGVAGRAQIIEVGLLTLGIKAGFSAPTGTDDAYISESALRFGGGVLSEVAAGPVAWLADAGLTARPTVETTEDFTLGSELTIGTGLRYDIRPGRFAAQVNYITHNGFTAFFEQQSAENPAEVVGGIQIRPQDKWRIDIGGGKGIADGYGTTAYRVMLGLMYIQRPVIEPPPPPPIIPDPPPPPPAVNIEEILEQKEEEAWAEGELARIVDEQIVIRDPIQFEFNTNNILPESIPTLEYVADLMNENGQIGFVTIEGHASAEGSDLYNYDLSERRARSIWEALIRAQVHPDRISYRSMGESQPKVEGEDEESLALNRRVEFHIVHQFGQLDDLPEYDTRVRAPWDGTWIEVQQPEFNHDLGKTDEQLEKEREAATYDPDQFKDGGDTERDSQDSQDSTEEGN